MKKTIFILFIVCLAVGCTKENSFPDTPILEHESFVIDDKTGLWTFSFTDGDGDLGSSNVDDRNYFQKKVYIEADTLREDTLVIPERLPEINTSGSSKAIEGEITKLIDLDLQKLKLKDTVYFTAYVIDQSGNISNTIKSSTLTRNADSTFSIVFIR